LDSAEEDEGLEEEVEVEGGHTEGLDDVMETEVEPGLGGMVSLLGAVVEVEETMDETERVRGAF
jgi:hypothetical protein